MDLMASLTEAMRRLVSNAQSDALVLLGKAQTILRALIRGIFGFFIMLMLSAYMLATSDRIFAFFRSLVAPGWRRNFDRLLERMDRGLSGVVRGQLMICLVNGVLSGIGFYLLDLPYWPILTLVATVLSIIPIFGAILSSVPAVIVALQDGVGTALLTLAWIIGIHQLEANVLNPKIMGDAAKVHPVLVIFALIAGEHFFGIAGALLAVPILSLAQSIFLHYRDVALGQPAEQKIPPAAMIPPPIEGPLADAPKNEAPSEGE
jgi:predicted PurR-regulated permease PerM